MQGNSHKPYLMDGLATSRKTASYSYRRRAQWAPLASQMPEAAPPCLRFAGSERASKAKCQPFLTAKCTFLLPGVTCLHYACQ